MTSDTQPQVTYPVRMEVDYAGYDRNRLTTFFRAITEIPILVLIMTLGAGNSIVASPTLLMILFRQKYPRWWFDFNVEYQRFSMRVTAYMLLLTDVYPSTDDEQGVHLDFDYPDAAQLNRFLPLFKWILAIPHYVALSILWSIALLLVVIGWLMILFTGKFPEGFHTFIVGVSRWGQRVMAYAFMLTTDEYPPFSLD